MVYAFQQSSLKRRVRVILLLLLVAGGVIFVWQKGTFFNKAAHSAPPEPKPAFSVNPTWPQQTAAAGIGAKDYGVLAVSGDEAPRPIASIAKVITSLALIEKYQLQPDQPGPTIPISEKDEQLYRDYVSQNGTVVLVKAGVPITLRQAIEAMILPSANNIADTAATWGFGSMPEYHRYANAMLQRLDMKHTVVSVDASGLNSATKSTPRDLIKLGEAALKNPVLAEIVAKTSADMPVAGPIPNYNALVTKYGFNGIKPGDTIEAGITSLFSTKYSANGKDITLIGVILGAESYKASNAGAIELVDSIKKDVDAALK